MAHDRLLPPDYISSLRTRLLSGILSAQEVAWLLRCSKDTVHRIPRDQLPAYSCASRYRIYLLEDVSAYVRSCVRRNPAAEQLLVSITEQVLDSSLDSSRERSSDGERND
jgi:hypothetical protein